MILISNYEATPGIGEAASQLKAGAPALDAIEAGIRLVEEDPSIRRVATMRGPTFWAKSSSTPL